MPRLTGLLETALYVEDMDRSVHFFTKVMGLDPILRTDRLTAFDAGNKGVLLIFLRNGSLADIHAPGGVIPGHNGSGPLHMAFAIPASSYEEWLTHIRASGTVFRGEMQWNAGGKSIYFEDPDGHVIEVATPGIWPNY